MQKALWSNSISTHSSKIACYTLFWMKYSPSNSVWNFIGYGLSNKIQYLLLFKSKKFQIIFSKSYLTREGFPTVPRACWNSPITFSFLLKWIFSEKKFVWYSISYLFNLSWNIMKTNLLQLSTHQGLSNGMKNASRGTMAWEISTWQTNKMIQTNYLPS